MTRPTNADVARGMLWASVAIDTGLFVLNLVKGQYGDAALISIVLVALTAWLAESPKLYRWADARVDEAVNRHRMSTMAPEQMEHQIAHINGGGRAVERRH